MFDVKNLWIRWLQPVKVQISYLLWNHLEKIITVEKWKSYLSRDQCWVWLWGLRSPRQDAPALQSWREAKAKQQKRNWVEFCYIKGLMKRNHFLVVPLLCLHPYMNAWQQNKSLTWCSSRVFQSLSMLISSKKDSQRRHVQCANSGWLQWLIWNANFTYLGNISGRRFCFCLWWHFQRWFGQEGSDLSSDFLRCLHFLEGRQR